MSHLGISQSQELKQEQILAPQQIQSLEILAVPMLELQTKVSEELAANPVLELDRVPGESLASDMSREYDGPEELSNDYPESELKSGNDEIMDKIFQVADSWNSSNFSRLSYSADDDEKRQHFFESLTDDPSLQEQLLEQLRLSDCRKNIRDAAEMVIGSIDNSGYLRTHPADIATAGAFDLKTVDKAIALVQTFDPPGIAARDLKECLLLQLARKGQDKGLLAKLIKNYLEEISRNKLPLVAKKMNIDIEELYDLIEELKTLNPSPGAAIAPDVSVFVVPDVIVEKRNGEYVIVSNDDQIPRLRISGLYLKLMEDPATPEETKNYIKSKISSGKNLIKSLEQRQSTIRRIASVIIDTQYDFLENGIEQLHPLTMLQVANKLDLHETTVSRAIANKYIQLPSGLYEFKFFFTGGYQSSDGEELSSRSVKEKIREMIMSEDISSPLSDSTIADELKKAGLSVARRTVAKYREEMGIQSSHLRRSF